MSRASTPWRRFNKKGVDGRDKPGHDVRMLLRKWEML